MVDIPSIPTITDSGVQPAQPPIQIGPQVGQTVAPQSPPAPMLHVSGPFDAPTVSAPDDPSTQVLAARTDYALGDQSPGPQALATSISQGGLDAIRQNAAVAQSLAEKRQNMITINQIASQAAARGTPLTAEEQLKLINLSGTSIPPLSTILETKGATRYIDNITQNETEQDNLAGEASANDPVGTQQVLDAGKALAIRQGIAQTLLTQAQQDYRSVPLLGKIEDWTYGQLPFFDYAIQRGQINETTGGFGAGRNMADQISALYLLPPDEFKQRTQEIYNNLKQRSPRDALGFASALVGYSATDAAADNFSTLQDVANAAPIVAGVAGLAKIGKGVKAATALAEGTEEAETAEALTNRVKQGVQANATSSPIRPQDIQTAAGANEAAANTQVVKSFQNAVVADPNAPAGTPQRTMAELMHEQPGLFDPQVYARNIGTLNNAQADRITDTLAASGKHFASMYGDITVVPRVLNPDAVDTMIKNARAQFTQTYPSLEHTILDVLPERSSEEAFGGTDQIKILIGDKQATPFRTKGNAKFYASNIYRLTPDSYTVEPRGGQYVIQVTKPLDETAENVANLRIATDNPKNPWHTLVDNLLNLSRVNAIRSPDYVLPKYMNDIRKVMTYGEGETLRHLRNAAAPIGKLKGEKLDRLKGILDQNALETRTYTRADGTTFSAPGNLYDTYGDYTTAYRKLYGENPTEDEVAAYFTIRNLKLNDWHATNLAALRNKQRLGAMQHSIAFMQPSNQGERMLYSDWFEGRQLDKLPDWSAEPFTVAWVDQKGKIQFKLSNQMYFAQRKALDDLMASGKMKVIQPLNKFDKSVKDLIPKVRGTPVDYILTGNVKSKPLSALQVEYRHGITPVFPGNGHYIKQMTSWPDNFGRRVIAADKTVAYFPHTAQGLKMLEAYNKGRQMIVDGVSGPKLAAFVRRNLPYRSGKEFRALFRDPKTPGSTGWDLHTPFVLTRPGVRATDVMDLRKTFPDKTGFIDLRTSEHNAMAQYDTRFPYDTNAGLNTIEETGTEQNPSFKFQPVQSMDPLKVLQNTSRKLANQRFMEDYKITATEDWINQFKSILDHSPGELRATPLQVMRNPVYKRGASPVLVAAAQNSRRAHLYLLGQNTVVRDAFESMRDTLLSSVYQKFGFNAANNKMLRILDWTKNSDPAGMLRGLAFAEKFMFNPAELYLQGQSVMSAAAIDGNPIRTARAGGLSLLIRIARQGQFNEKYVAAVAKMGEDVLHIPRERFMEAFNTINRTGMMNIGNEVSQLNNAFDPKIIGDAKTKFWNMSMAPFSEGERLPRLQGFTTAYLEWRDANPTAKLTPAIERNLITRGDNMSTNMTRASNNPLLQGKVSGVFTQWATYYTRLTEQMLSGGITGKGKLSLAEKARMILMYSTIYGVPTGTAGLVAGPLWNWYNEGEKYALNHGIDTYSNPWAKAFFEGFGSMAVDFILADGENTDFSQRFGPGGLDWLHDLIKEGKVSQLFGPAPGIFLHLLSKQEPFTRSLLSVFDPNPDDEIPLTAEDFLSVFRDISVVNNVAAGYYAFNTGRLITQGEIPMDNMDQRMASLHMLLSLSPRTTADTWLKNESLKDVQNAKSVLEKQALVYMERGLRAAAAANGQPSPEAVKNFKIAHAILLGGNYNPMEYGQIWMHLWTEGNQTLAEKIGKDYVMHSPNSDIYQNLYNWQQEINSNYGNPGSPKYNPNTPNGVK